jgi:UDP-glucose 4-epimerase
MSLIMVVGGAGYIGSHMVKALKQAGKDVLVVDNFSTGFRSAVAGCEIAEVDIADKQALARVFATYDIQTVMHFASYIQVGESVRKPGMYYSNNFSATLSLLECMVEAGVGQFIFSSTAAVYGEPEYMPLDEAHPRRPINPYGHSKLMVEQALADFDAAHGLKSVCLRYFNAAGADPDGELGERHEPETHLIPLILQAASKRREVITVFGRDYNTPDGTCIRDYIHINDLASAHALAIDYLGRGGASTAFNLGNGNGFSVQEVIEAARKVTGREINVVDAERRPGDPPRLVADATLARNTLGWTPQYNDLETIIAHAWAWEQQYPWL